MEVEPVFNYFISQKDRDAQIDEIYSWCVENFEPAGEFSKIPHVNWFMLGRSYFFSDPKHATAFALRWS